MSFGDAPREEQEAGLFLRRLAAAAAAAAGDRAEEPGDAPLAPAPAVPPAEAGVLFAPAGETEDTPLAPPEVGRFVAPAGETEDTPLLDDDEEEKAYGLVRRVDIGGGADTRPWEGEAPFTGVVRAPPAFLESSGVPPELAPLVVEAPARPTDAGPLAGDGEGDPSLAPPGRGLERRRSLVPPPPGGEVNPLPSPLDPPLPWGPGNKHKAGFGLLRPGPADGVPCSPRAAVPALALVFVVPLPPLLRASDDPLPDNSPPEDPRGGWGCFDLLGEAVASSAAMVATPGRRRRRAAPSRFA